MLINCVAYENGSRLADMAVEEISDYLAKPVGRNELMAALARWTNTPSQ